jgi:pyruvate/2-oxoglutarate dehydrogenase complex dihydrolipoamide dehydrogenase (E3) component
VSERYDLAVIGAGSGGLVGASFAAQLGARVVLIEQGRIGGDCTWTGCVPSKALLKAARVAHEVRHSHRFGVDAPPPQVDMKRVAAYVRRAIDTVYEEENPAALAARGIEFLHGATEFTDESHVRVGDRVILAKRFLICTGAQAAVPPIPGLRDIPFLTYETFFENDRLPEHLLVIGSGPIGVELALAYRRLGADVTLIGRELLPREDDDVRAFVTEALRNEGITLIQAAATGTSRNGSDVTVRAGAQGATGDMLLVATGRIPRVDGLALHKANVAHDAMGIQVDRYLRTSAPHIYAAGDVVGGPQYTHYAGWQAFLAVRNALLPGRSNATTDAVPRVTFLDPEVAHVGPGEREARERHGDRLQIHRLELQHADRAITDGEAVGFIKVLTTEKQRLVGATVVAARAGELIAEYALALEQRLTLGEIARTIHPYPTWSTAVQQLASDAASAAFKRSWLGKLASRVSGLHRKNSDRPD